MPAIVRQTGDGGDHSFLNSSSYLVAEIEFGRSKVWVGACTLLSDKEVGERLLAGYKV